MKNKANINFKDSLERVYAIINMHVEKKPIIIVRKMKARLGSADKSKNSIVLNYDLIKAPKYCIDYVILHELTHFIHKNHNKEFYEFLTVIMPDWNKRKEILEGEIIRHI